jgi:hypothetical protein
LMAFIRTKPARPIANQKRLSWIDEVLCLVGAAGGASVI